MRRKRVRLGIVLGLFALVLSALWLELHALHRAALMTELAEWEAAGGKRSLRAMLPETVEVERNAGLGLYRAFARMPRPTPAQAALLSEPWHAVGLPEVILAYGPTLDQVREAVDLPDTLWPVTYEDGERAQRRHLQPAQVVVRLLIAEAIVRAESGDAQGAAASIEAGLMLGEHLRADPSFHAMSIQRELEGWLLAALERIFDLRPLPPSDLERILARRDYRADVRRALLAEGAMWLMQIDLAAGAGDVLTPRYSTSEIRYDTAVYLRSLRGFADYFALPYHRAALDAADPPAPPQWARLLQTLVHQRETFSRALAVGETRLAMARLAVGLRAIKSRDGEYPASLDGFGELGVDPLSGERLRYARVDEGFAIWSDADIGGGRVGWHWSR